MAAAHSLSGRGAAQAHIAELDVFSEEEPAICGHGRQPPTPHHHHTTADTHTQNPHNRTIVKENHRQYDRKET